MIPGVPDPWWQSQALSAIQVLADEGAPFTAHDLVARDDIALAEPDHPNRWGAVFNRAKALGIVRCVGITRSKRPSRNGGYCAQWQGGTV